MWAQWNALVMICVSTKWVLIGVLKWGKFCLSFAYNDALDFLGNPRITTYNEAICDKMFDAIVKDSAV